ncbi:MAG TPA: glycosyltransferase [candidate division Zixibacteria bacterium]|nr:glycosyltransferase [candidate division Zixibacteria bacterium]
MTMVNKRFRLGIIFNFNPVWMGGIIYILNVIRILDFLDDDEKPEITLFYRSDLKKFVDQVEYPYFKAVEWKFPSICKGYVMSWLTGKNIFIDGILRQYDLDGLYPLHDYPVKTKTSVKLVCWYADLQHKYYPGFFTKRKVLERNARLKFILRNTDDLVVSSHAVANDFNKFFHLRKDLRMHIFHFASVIEDISGLDISEVRKKYNLPEKYFMVSNQFHKHKNHKVLLKALVRLKERGSNVHLVMTGRFPVASHSPYMRELHSLISEHNLQSQISLLGIVPRNEQLLLMKHSQAVLQPSLFEGWSTVIEDAISLQVPVIASSLPVNIEQLGPAGIYFDPHDDEKLAEILYNFPERNLNDVFYEKYEDHIRNAAKVFINIFRK